MNKDLEKSIRNYFKGKKIDYPNLMGQPRESKRELDVIVCIIQGLNNQEIADKLCVSIKTIKFHISNILNRHECSSRSKLTWKFWNNYYKRK